MICSIVSVVDDDPMVRDSMVDLLNSYEYTALGFETAFEFGRGRKYLLPDHRPAVAWPERNRLTKTFTRDRVSDAGDLHHCPP